MKGASRMRKTIAIIISVFLLIFSFTSVVSAESTDSMREMNHIDFATVTGAKSLSISNDQTKTYFFYLPGGGISTCLVYILYREDYTHSNSTNNNTFISRGKYYTGQYTYATTCPSMTTGACVIKNGSGGTYLTLSSWTKVSSIYNGSPDVYGYYENYSSFTLSDTTSYTGQVNYTITCSGAYASTQPDNVSMGLATN